MTREEQAIEYIKKYRELDEKLYNTTPKGTVSSIATKKCLEFWDIAIKALKQQLCDNFEVKKIDEWKIKGKNAELWIVKGNLQVHYLGTIHNIPLSLVTSQAIEQQSTSISGIENMPCITSEEMQKCKDTVKKYTPKQQPCDDAISREAVIKWLKAKDIIKLSSQEETARKELKALPPVTPQKYGKWIDYSDEGFVECPFCGHATNCEDNINELHYCFYCGACMKDGRTLDEFIEDSKESEEA